MKNLTEIADDLMVKAKKAGADYADVIVGNDKSRSVEVRFGKLDKIEAYEELSYGLRVIVGKKYANVSAANLKDNELQELVERAVSMARSSTEDQYIDYIKEKTDISILPDLEIYDAEGEATNDWMIEQSKIMEEAALGVKDVTNSEGAGASYTENSFILTTTSGTSYSQKYKGFYMGASVIASKDGKMESDYEYDFKLFKNQLKDPKLVGEEAGKLAAKKLGAKKIKSTNASVIFPRRFSKGMLGALAAAINGSSVSQQKTFLHDKMGKEIFAPNINIIDDPLIMGGFGSRVIDAETLPTKKLALVENGILKSWLLDLRSAKKLGLKSTASASRGAGSNPYPSSSNLYMQPGDISSEDMIKGLERGLIISGLFGNGYNIITGDYSVGVSGFWVENGEVIHPVSEITIAGNLKDMFKNMVAANDLEMRHATNAPTIKINNMTIAGL